MPTRGRRRAPEGPLIGGKPWTPLCAAPTPGQHLAYQAHRAYMALSHGFRVLAEQGGKDPRIHRGVLVRITNDHPTRRQMGNGSTLILHFDSGSSVPLEHVQRLERAPD